MFLTKVVVLNQYFFNEKKKEIERFGKLLTFPCLVLKLLTALDYKQTALKMWLKIIIHGL